MKISSIFVAFLENMNFTKIFEHVFQSDLNVCDQKFNIELLFLDKRFKTSPFAWTNPLSGFKLFVIPEGRSNSPKRFQLRLVKDPSDLFKGG